MNKYFQIICMLFVISSCSKSGNNSSAANTDFFPAVIVDIRGINLGFGQYTALTMPGGWYYFAGGNKGIFLYHNASSDDFVAFDRTCPVNPKDTCAFVSMDSSQLFLICSQTHVYTNNINASPLSKCKVAGACNSTFQPDLGVQRSGSATRGLKLYHVNKTSDGTNIVLSITN